MFFMSVHTLLAEVKINFLNVSSWSMALLFGVLIGWSLIKIYALRSFGKPCRSKPGGISTLLILISVFVTKYFFGLIRAIDPGFVAGKSGLKLLC